MTWVYLSIGTTLVAVALTGRWLYRRWMRRRRLELRLRRIKDS